MASPEEIAQQLVDAFNNRTYVDDASKFYTDDTVFVDNATGQEGMGIEAGIMSSDVWVQALPDAQAEVISHEVDGNTVTTTVIGRGTFTGQMMTPDGQTIPGNGATMELEYVQTIFLDGDTVVRQEASYDAQDMMSQLGLG